MKRTKSPSSTTARRAARPARTAAAEPQAGSAIGAAGALALILGAAFWLHRPALRAPFFADDYLFLDQVRGRNLIAALLAPDPIGNFMRPVGRAFDFWVLSHMGGESPFVFHVANLVLFLGAVALLFVIVRRLAGGRAAAVAAAFLALSHAADVPLRWASGAQDLLALFFALAAIALHQRGRGGWAAICFALGMLSKETIVFTPFIAVLVDSSGGWIASRLRRAWPLFVALIAWLALWLATAQLRPAAAGVVHLDLVGAPAAFAHLVQTAIGLEWAKGTPSSHMTMPPWGPIVLAFAAIALAWSVFRATRARGAARDTTDRLMIALIGLAWAALGALPVAAVASIWSAYYYLFALCGVALVLGAVVARWPRALALALIGVLAWSSESVRRAPSFATVPGVWTTRSHVSVAYLERSASLVSGYLARLRAARPTLPPNATLFFRGVPAFAGWQAGNGALQRWAYRDTSVRSYYLAEFTADRARRGPLYFFSSEGDSLTEIWKKISPYQQIAFSMTAEDRPQAARDAMLIAQERGAFDNEAAYLWAWNEWALGHRDRAAELLSGLGMKPDAEPSPQAGRAQRMLALYSDTVTALDMLRQARYHHTLNPAIHARLADLLLARRGTDAEAYIEAYAAHVLEPDSPSALRRWAGVQLRLKRYRQALATLERYFAFAGASANEDEEAKAWRQELTRLLRTDVGVIPQKAAGAGPNRR